MRHVMLRRMGAAAMVALVTFGGGYLWARSVYQPAIVEIVTTACSVPPETARFGVPLEAILAAAQGLSFGIGPVDVPHGGGAVRFRFDPEADAAARDVRLVRDTLYLPTGFGPDRRAPRRITVQCRDGAIGAVRYQSAGRDNATFGVVRASDTAMIPEGGDPADDPAPTKTD